LWIGGDYDKKSSRNKHGFVMSQCNKLITDQYIGRNCKEDCDSFIALARIHQGDAHAKGCWDNAKYDEPYK